MSIVDAVIIGGGSTGAAIAFHLAGRGKGRVMLVEQSTLASGATGQSSAIVRTHYTFEPLARMAFFSLEVFSEFADRVGGDSGFEATGFLVLAGGDDVEPLKAAVEMNRTVGIRTQALSLHEVAAVEPRIDLDGVAIGAWEPESGRADPHSTTISYGKAAQSLGVDIRQGVKVSSLIAGKDGVQGVTTTEGKVLTDTVIVAAGYRSRDLLRPVGVDLPLVPIRHVMGVIERTVRFGPVHPIVSDRARGNYYVPEGQNLTLVGSNAAMAGDLDFNVEAQRNADPESLERLVERFSNRFPGEGDATLRGGFTGVYDCSPDLQPLLGPVAGLAGLHVAAGFSGHGFKLCPAVGELIAEQICTGRTTLVDLSLFGPMRFMENRPIRPSYTYSHRIDGIGSETSHS
jgi:sarcosine oxidase subunit beta